MSEVPRKQFKSQSVNNLFRQQATTQKDPLKDPRKTTRSSPTPTTTKVKLVSRRKPNGIKKKSPTPPPESPISSIINDAVAETLSVKASETTIEPTDDTQSTEVKPSLKGSLMAEILTERSLSSSVLEKTPNHSEWAEGEWSDLQSQIATHTNSPESRIKPSRTKSEMILTYSPEAATSWSSPNSKISSFRRSAVTTPMIHSLSQSPLSKPTDSFPPELIINRNVFGDRFPGRVPEPRANTIGLGSHQHAQQQLQQRQSTQENEQWNSPTIWNTEDRHLSTKSDSALGSSWTPFDIENLSLDDPFKTQPPLIEQYQSSSQSPVPSRTGSVTSRFFPARLIDQNPSFDQFPRQPSLVEGIPAHFHPIAPPFNLMNNQQSPQSPSVNDFQGRTLFQEMSNEPHESLEERVYPDTFVNSSQKLDKEIYPESFQTDMTQIPVSLPLSLESETFSPYYRRPVSYEQQPYPEGFSSTFYKRGNNNFMFIRELQPKLVTSKNRDTVEVRVSFPSTKMDSEEDDKDAMIKMRCHIVNVDVKELEGRIAGVKVFKTGNSARSRGFSKYYRGHGKR